jgi:hypothetical protein
MNGWMDGWMMCEQETLFHCIFVPKTNHSGYLCN